MTPNPPAPDPLSMPVGALAAHADPVQVGTSLRATAHAMAESGLHAIAVVGGGPAGCAAALSHLRSSHREVHLFTAHETPRHAVGESVPPAFNAALAQLGEQSLMDATGPHTTCPGSLSIWNNPTPGGNDFLLMGAGYLEKNRQ